MSASQISGGGGAAGLPPPLTLDKGAASCGGGAEGGRPRTRSQARSAAAAAAAAAASAGRGKSRGRAGGKGGGRAAAKAGPPSLSFTHVGGGGTGKVYTATCAEKAAKKVWRECKHLAVIEVKSSTVSGGGGEEGEVWRFTAADWAGRGHAKAKFAEKGRSHRSKSASFAGRGAAA
jgi:hypothetical protein